jgi:hypothetical protein
LNFLKESYFSLLLSFWLKRETISLKGICSNQRNLNIKIAKDDGFMYRKSIYINHQECLVSGLFGWGLSSCCPVYPYFPDCPYCLICPVWSGCPYFANYAVCPWCPVVPVCAVCPVCPDCPVCCAYPDCAAPVCWLLVGQLVPSLFDLLPVELLIDVFEIN